MDNDLHQRVQRTTTEQVQAPEQTEATQNTQVLEAPPETLVQPFQRTEVTAPVLTEETRQRNEEFRSRVEERLENLRARYSAPVDERLHSPTDTRPAVSARRGGRRRAPSRRRATSIRSNCRQS